MSNSVAMIEQQLQSVLSRLEEVERKEGDLVKRMKNCIKLCHDLMCAWRQGVVLHGFPDKRSEIYFFKWAKPLIAGRYRYYQRVLQLNLGEWKGAWASQEQRLVKEMGYIENIFAVHRSLWEYYRSGAVHLDEAWFLRGQELWLLHPDIGYFDESFCTRCDGQLAELLAMEMYCGYIGRRLAGDEDHIVAERSPASDSAIVFTGTATQATVLGYALYEVNSLNHGNASRQGVMDQLGKQWSIDLRNHRQIINRVIGQQEPDRFLKDLLDGFNRFLSTKDL